jgi:hypothetical protein
MKRAGTAQEIAQAFVFLASDKVDHLTGQIIGVNGGKTLLDRNSFSENDMAWATPDVGARR